MAKLETKTMGLMFVLFLVGIGVGYPIGMAATPPKVVEKVVEKPVHPLKGDILIGAICASTAGLEWNKPTIEIALEEINAYVSALGIPVTFKVLIEDAEGSAVRALEKFQSLHAKGVKFFVEFRWSSHVKAVKEYADANKLLIVSDGSTSPLLAIPDDYVFRLVCDDTVQGVAIARMLIDYGIRATVVMQRADAWGDGLYAEFKRWFTEWGGTIVDHIRYDPDKTEFSAELRTVAARIKEAIAKYGEGKVAFEILSFEEAVVMQAQAKDYPELMTVPWFGSDGHVVSTRLIDEAGALALKTKHISTYMGVTESAKYKAFVDKFTPKVGYTPGTYAVLLYDSLWVLAKAILEAGAYNPEIVKKVLPTAAGAYFGASGWTVLNKAGDRAGGNYDIWAVVEKGEVPRKGELGWKRIGFYDYLSGKVVWFEKV